MLKNVRCLFQDHQFSKLQSWNRNPKIVTGTATLQKQISIHINGAIVDSTFCTGMPLSLENYLG